MTVRGFLAIAVLILVAAMPSVARARPCTCDDIKDMEATLDMIDQTRRAWYSILANIQGHAKDAPTTLDAAVNQFIDKMGWKEVKKVGGLNDRGEPVVDEAYKQAHCDDIGDSVTAHENAHANYFYWRVLWLAAAAPSTLTKVLVRSEVDARDVQEAYLKKKLAKVRKECGNWKCRCTKEQFKTAADCSAQCPHASFNCVAPTCLKLDPATGKWTGEGI